jgi:RNA polymerase-binding transcription factor DksA
LKEVDVTAAKKATPPSSKKAASAGSVSKRRPSTKVTPKSASGSKAPTAKKPSPAAKKPTAQKATKKSASRAKPSDPVRKKSAPAAKKAAPAAKKPSPAAKKATAPKKAAPAVKKVATKAEAPPAPKRPTVGPYAKDSKFLDEQRVLLLEERSVYAGQAVDLRAEADSLALEREPGDVQFDEESGEGGTVTVDRERNLALSAQASAAVEEIDDALRKIDRKLYGGCERCHHPIPKARLRALPFARLCVACKSGGLSRR